MASGKMFFQTPLSAIEQRFDSTKSLEWISKHWNVSVYTSVLYVFLVHAGRRWMQDKAALSLRRPLVMWNTGLAVFSFIGMINTIFPVISALWENGLTYTACQRILYDSPTMALWTFLFTFSKMIELGDTLFVVLRKTPLSFLHWYHHISVMLYCWCLHELKPAPGNWFVSLNYLVHSIMYTYYAFKASGYVIPSCVAQVITVLQLSQFVVGIGITLLAYSNREAGIECFLDDKTLYFALGMYGSYFVLFLNFFYHRYLKK